MGISVHQRVGFDDTKGLNCFQLWETRSRVKTQQTNIGYNGRPTSMLLRWKQNHQQARRRSLMPSFHRLKPNHWNLLKIPKIQFATGTAGSPAGRRLCQGFVGLCGEKYRRDASGHRSWQRVLFSFGEFLSKCSSLAYLTH